MNVTRRSFLATGMAAAAAPLVLGTTDKAGNKAAVVGEGDHKYEAIHDWGQLPTNIKYGNTHGVCEDSQGHIYIHHTVHASSDSPDTIVVFDEKGKFVRSWGKQFKGGAHGLLLRKEGSEEFLYLCDYAHGIVTKRTLKGEEVFTLGYPVESSAYEKGRNNGPVNYQPTNVAIAPNGDFYVGDGYGSSYINQYNKRRSIHTNFRRARQRAGTVGLSSRPVGRYSSRNADSRRGGSLEPALATVHPRRPAHRLHPGYQQTTLPLP